MTPDELAKSGSEHGEQRALFAWAKCAQFYGFAHAWNDATYSCEPELATWHPVLELAWMHAIPNGGSRGDDAKSRAMQGAKLKAEGVKKGVLDVFLPLPMKLTSCGPTDGYVPTRYHGLYIEMKRKQTDKEGVRKARIIDQAAGATSREQDAFIVWARSHGYAVGIYFDWRSAAKDIQTYIEQVRLNA